MCRGIIEIASGLRTTLPLILMRNYDLTSLKKSELAEIDAEAT